MCADGIAWSSCVSSLVGSHKAHAMALPHPGSVGSPKSENPSYTTPGDSPPRYVRGVTMR